MSNEIVLNNIIEVYETNDEKSVNKRLAQQWVLLGIKTSSGYYILGRPKGVQEYEEPPKSKEELEYEKNYQEFMEKILEKSKSST